MGENRKAVGNWVDYAHHFILCIFIFKIYSITGAPVLISLSLQADTKALLSIVLFFFFFFFWNTIGFLIISFGILTVKCYCQKWREGEFLAPDMSDLTSAVGNSWSNCCLKGLNQFGRRVTSASLSRWNKAEWGCSAVFSDLKRGMHGI